MDWGDSSVGGILASHAESWVPCCTQKQTDALAYAYYPSTGTEAGRPEVEGYPQKPIS